MSAEGIAILAVGVSLAARIVSGQRSFCADLAAGLATASAERSAIRADLAALRGDLHALAERIARLEGVVPFLTSRNLAVVEKRETQPTS